MHDIARPCIHTTFYQRAMCMCMRSGSELNGTLYFILPFAYVADMIEAYALAGLQGVTADFPSPTHLAHKNELDSEDKVFERRSERSQRKVGAGSDA